MKIKNVNIFVRHVEKAVLGLSIIVALLIYWFYISGQPYAVPMGNAKTMTVPGEVPKLVGNEAKKLQGKVNSNTTQLPPIPVPPFAQVYQKQLRASLSGNVLAYDVMMGQHGLDKPIGDGIGIDFIEYSLPASSPAPIIQRTRADLAVLKELPVEEMKQWVALIGHDLKPRDFRLVTITASFDWDLWRARLREAKPRPLPESQWRAMLAATGVTLYRRQIDEVNGQMIGSEEVIRQLPGNQAFITPAVRLNRAEGKQLIDTIRANQDLVLRPSPPPVADEKALAAPDAAAGRPAAQVEHASGARGIQEEIKKIEEQIAKLKEGISKNMVDKAKATADINKLNEQLTKKRTELRTHAAVAPKVKPTAPGAIKPGADPAKQVEPLKEAEPVPPATVEPDSASGERVTLVAYDPTAKAGCTYQYALELSVLNPLFMKDGLSPSQHQEYFQKLSFKADRSDWSAAVGISEDTYVFFVNAAKIENKAIIEVVRLSGGQWRSKEFTVQPGDTVGGIVDSVDYHTGITVVDLLFDQPAQTPGAATSRLLFVSDRSERLQDRTIETDRGLREKFMTEQ